MESPCVADKTPDEVPLVTAVSILHLSEANINEDGEESSLAPEAVLVDQIDQIVDEDFTPDDSSVRFPVPQVIQVPGIPSSLGSSHASLSLPSQPSVSGPPDAESTNSPQSYPTDDTVVGSQESCFSSLLHEYSSCSLSRLSIDPPGSDADSVVSTTSSRLSVDPPGSTGEELQLARTVRPDPPVDDKQSQNSTPRRNFKFLGRPPSHRNLWRPPPHHPFSRRGARVAAIHHSNRGAPAVGPKRVYRPNQPPIRPDPPEASLLAAAASSSSKFDRPGAYRMPPRVEDRLRGGIPRSVPEHDDKAFVCLEATLVQEESSNQPKDGATPKIPLASKLTVEVSLTKETTTDATARAANKFKRCSRRLLFLLLVTAVFLVTMGIGLELWHHQCEDDEVSSSATTSPSQLRHNSGKPNPYELVLAAAHVEECSSQKSDYQFCLNTRLSSNRATLCTQCVQDAIHLTLDDSSCDADGFCTNINALCDCGPCKIDIVEWLDCSLGDDDDNDDSDSDGSCHIDCYK